MKRLEYDEESGEVRYRASNGKVKTWKHAVEFLASLVQHTPRSHQQTASYHGWFANPSGNLQQGRKPQEKAAPAPNNISVLIQTPAP
ncbi:MAG: hypothetical protein AB1758_28510 [Candidatus Eremiobacterota bacterium]